MKTFSAFGFAFLLAVLAVSCGKNPYYLPDTNGRSVSMVNKGQVMPETQTAAVSAGGMPVAAPKPVRQVSAEIMMDEIRDLAGQIKGNLNEFNIKESMIVVTTFVDAGSFATTSAFGRYITEQLIFELHNFNYRIFEMRQAETIDIVYEKGEFNLTRIKSKLLNKYRSDAIIVGTYSVLGNEVIVHARMLERDTSRVVSVAAISLEFDKFPMVKDMINQNRSGIPMESVLIRPLEEN